MIDPLTKIYTEEVNKVLSDQQKQFLNSYVVGKWVIDENGYCNVFGDVSAPTAAKSSQFGGIAKSSNKISGNELPVKFGTIFKTHVLDSGCFNIQMFADVASLNNCPFEVHGNFEARNQSFSTLEGGPEKVFGNYNVSFNLLNLVSLKGCPKFVGGIFDIHGCLGLKRLDYFPDRVESLIVDVQIPYSDLLKYYDRITSGNIKVYDAGKGLWYLDSDQLKKDYEIHRELQHPELGNLDI